MPRLLPLLLLGILLPRAALALPSSVVLVGDSITHGIVSGGGTPYAPLLADALGGDFAVANLGCGGASSLDWTLSRGGAICGGEPFQIPNLYQARARAQLPAEIVTILLGTNDALGFFEPEVVSAQAYSDAISEIVDHLLADGAEQVMLMTPPQNFQSLSAQFNLAAYRLEILALCGTDPAVLCGPDLFSLLGAADFATGNLHPNAAGHQKIADALTPAILAALAIPEPAPSALLAAGCAILGLARRRGAGLRSRGC